MAMQMERRSGLDRRQRERRSRQDNPHDDVRENISRNAEKIERLEAEQRLQFIRIAQLQHELDELRKSRGST